MTKQTTFEGRLLKDPELYYTKTGFAICKFSIAASLTMQNIQYSFIAVDSHDKLAEDCIKYLKKDSNIKVTGILKTQSWKNKQGEQRNILNIDSNTMTFLLNKEEV